VSVDYDLVVIGGSQAARYAALAATHLKARVALVEPQQTGENWLMSGYMYSRTATHIGLVAQQVRDANQFGVHLLADSTEDSKDIGEQPNRHRLGDRVFVSIRFDEAMQYARSVVSTLEEQNSPAILSSLGVDVIVGSGEFSRKPHLAFVVNGRRLRSRAFLIATGSTPAVPEIDGLQDAGYLTPADIWRADITKPLAKNWVVIGGTPTGTEMAQTLARLGADVTLVTSRSRILAKEDQETAFLVQAQLEAEGVRVITDSPITQVRQIESKKWVQAGNKAIETDEILLATRHLPKIESLNLESVGVKFHPRGLHISEKLQTTNSRIYACGDVTGGYQLAYIAEYEAKIALKNALLLPIFKINYREIPYCIFSSPQLARIGMTEEQARGRYGKDVLVLRQYFKSVAAALMIGETTGLCKIVVRGNGEILGASIVGFQAVDLIQAIALAMQQKIKVGAIADFPHISPTLSDITYQAAAEWDKQRLSHNNSLQKFLEGFFNLRRSWSK